MEDMIAWEYKSAEFKVLGIENGLNTLGKDGWELIHIEYVPGIYRILFKRPMAFDHPMVGL